MNKLYGAVDETNDGEFLAFVICDEISLSRHFASLPQEFTHMSNPMYPQVIKKQIIDNLDLDGNISAYCVRFDLPTVNGMLKKIKDKIPRTKIQKKISYRMVRSFEDMCTGFLAKNKQNIRQVEFEVDNRDVKIFLRDGGLKCTEQSKTHKIADCVAFANFKGWDVKGNVIEKREDFSKEFISNVREDFKK